MIDNSCEEATQLLAEALQMDPTAVGESTTLGVTYQWDSLAHMRLILCIEERIGKQLTADAIVGITGVQDVVTLLSRS